MAFRYYYACTIESVNDDGTYNLSGEDIEGDDDGIVRNVPKEDLRREAKPGDGEAAAYRAAYG